MKFCKSCGFEKELSEFAWKNKVKGTLSSSCKPCHSEFSKQHYHDNLAKRRSQVKKNRELNRQLLKDVIWTHLITHQCVDCGESDPIVLEFDHRSDKEFSISNATNNHVTVERLIKEIEKCDIRCANCHRRKTAIEFNWWPDKNWNIDKD